MDMVRLNNGVEMPLVGLGTWELRGEECAQVVAQALALGYRLIDTAQLYDNEAAVGRGLAASGVPRSEIFLTTKVLKAVGTYDSVSRSIDESLRRLGTDYVDLLLLHEPRPESPQLYRALEAALRAGKARAIGVSNFTARWYDALVPGCEIVPAVNQMEVHLFYQRWAFHEAMQHHGTHLQAWSPLARNIDGAAEHPVLVAIGEKYGKTAAQVALRSLVQRGISIVPKSRHTARLAENLALFDFVLTEEEMEQIRALDRNATLFDWTRALE